jgi:hypothetical protein
MRDEPVTEPVHRFDRIAAARIDERATQNVHVGA